MSSYYDLLGVDTDAGKEDIRAAYRDRLDGATQADRAKLNKAWNVLSDPVQRGRYNDFLESSSEFGDDDDRDETAVPARSGRGAPATRGGKPTRERPPPRAPLAPTIELPAGMEFARKRARNLAMLFDVAILMVVFMVSLQVIPGVVDSTYTKQVDQYNAQVKVFDKLDSARGKAQTAADAAVSKAKAAEKKGSIDATTLRAKATDLTATAKTKKATADTQNTELKRLAKAVPIAPQYAAIGVVLAFGLLYTVPSSARTGQTFGKRFQKIRLVQVDGAPAGWWSSFVHFLVPLGIAFGLFLQLQGLAAILGIGAVLWNLRDRNRQGLHDKLAKTIVVANV